VTRVLGIEGTAWCASAAVFDAETDTVRIKSDAYQPESGGIHPREAADHMRSAVPAVVDAALAVVDEEYGPPAEALDAVAFSRGPGLGPCLRIAGTAARALAGSLELPLVGVNHMVAHLEIGRHRSRFDSPVCLNASGANAHLLGYRDGRYRVLGETMDTGVGNAIDKFTRHVGWTHPGGPKVEARAKEGEYVELPYVVKGMDFSFSGITSAAKQAYDDGTPVEDVCRGLEETVFAMLTEVSERALSLTQSAELVLGGGVGQNARLRSMLETMCTERGADFYAPEARFLRDNGGMIAVLGAKMYEAGDTLPIADSRVLPDFRPDEVPVTWCSGEAVAEPVPESEQVQGAEAVVELDPEAGRAQKRRLSKSYRHPELDRKLRTRRTRSEARLTSEARRLGVPTPVVFDVDPAAGDLSLEYVGAADLRDALTEPRVRAVGRHLACCHEGGFVHGDPTPRNVRVGRSEPRAATDGEPDDAFAALVDFGLGYYTDDVEDYAMDLHVFEGALGGTADDAAALLEGFEDAYREEGDPRAVEQLREIEGRGRYQ
jgi:N6-L-threonylcarbamoyladenine synthase/protein kinase Bud32